MKRFFLTLVSVMSIGVYAQSFDKAKLDSYFDVMEQNNQFMGSILLEKDGKTLYERSVGFSDVENKVKNSQNTRFRIGSITKTFTAIVILKAVEQKKLKLSETLDRFFPNIKNAHKINIEMLLQNRSGIASYTDDKKYHKEENYIRNISAEEILQDIASYPSDFEPNSKYEYSNSNFFLLGLIAEKVFKKSYSDLVEKFIIKPLELKNTYYGGKIGSKDNESFSYKFQNNTWIKSIEGDMSAAYSAGAMVSSTEDLIKFAKGLFGGKLLKKESLEQMKNLKDGYGYGLMLLPFYKKSGFGHGGKIDDFSSMIGYFPEDNIYFSKVYNAINTNANDIDIAVLSAVFGRDYKIPSFKTIEVTAEELTPYLGTYASER
ncbi:MAG: serine hydrolase domain-containing protein, partial [Bergeyella zoohelcum]|nr:serine hydrolase domain-containing protein [Bergeyella zoohelcum]